ncbi:MAG: ABC transporter substrate-binding protein, partial [Bacteroidota bacterium]
AAPEVFCVGAIDASVIYINNEPLQIRNRAQNGDCGAISDVNVLQIGEVIDLVSNGVITNQDMITNNPARVTAFINAYDQGLASTINNPARAYLLSSNHIESLPLDDDFRVALETLANDQDAFLMTMPNRDEVAQSRTEQREFLSQQFDANILLQFDILLASIELWDADQLGFTDEESWINMQDTLLALGQLGEAADISDIFTNDFLPTNDE